MTDLIERQAAIDAIVNCTNCGDEKTLRAYVAKHNLDNGWTGGILEAIDAIEDLPSEQLYTAEEIQKMQELESAQVEKAYELGREYAQPEEAIPISWIEAMIEKFIMAGDAFSGLTASIIRVMLNEWEREQEGDTK